MLYVEKFGLRDCSGFSQIKSYMCLCSYMYFNRNQPYLKMLQILQKTRKVCVDNCIYSYTYKAVLQLCMSLVDYYLIII